jgi:hypothetical protein
VWTHNEALNRLALIKGIQADIDIYYDLTSSGINGNILKSYCLTGLDIDRLRPDLFASRFDAELM